MRAIVALVAIVLGLLLSAPIAAATDITETKASYLVSLTDKMPVHAFLKATKIDATYVYEHALNGFAADMYPYQARGILHNPFVQAVQRDLEVSLVAQTLPTGIDRIEADLNAISNIDGIDDRVDGDIAILDTGVDMDHPDLNVAGGVFCIETSPEDGHGHGTHVSGTAAALDNGFGVVGVAPGARIWAVKVLNSGGSGTFASVACGIDWSVANAAVIEVISMSLAGSGSDDGNCGFTNGDILHQAVCRAVDVGIVVVVAAANSNADAKFFVPAAYDEVITVSAVQDLDGQPGNDFLASFSNWGEDVDIAAPGVNIWSTDKNGGYRYFSGTSMSTPHVSGAVVIAILLDGKPTDKAGTKALKVFLIANGAVPQTDPKGFTGDRDAFPEPMLLIENLDGEPAPPPDPDPSPPLPIETEFTFNPTLPNVGDTVQFDSTTTGGKTPYTFAWNLGDGGSSTVEDPSHVYTISGTYTAALIATDADGVTASASQDVTVTDEDVTAPVVVFLSPLDGDLVWWKITVHIRATDDGVVMLTELYIDGRLKASVASGDFLYTLQTQGLRSGTHTFMAVAYDAAGNIGTTVISVTTVKMTGKK